MIKGLLTLLVGANTKGFDKALGKSGKRLTAFQKLTKSASKQLAQFAGAFTLLAIGRDITQRIIKFDAAMVGLSAILRTSRKDIANLEKQAISLGGATIFTANQVGELQTILARFGFSATEIDQSTRAVLDLAAAARVDLSLAADTSAATLRAFNLDASEMTRVVDVMANAFTKSALDIETFSAAMIFAAPLATAAGSSIEETSAMLAILADNGIRGSIAGTSLRRIFTNLAESGKTMSQIFRENAGDIEAMGDAMGFAEDAVGRYALSAFLVLARNADAIAGVTEEMGEFGTANKVAEKQLTSLENKMVLLNSAWEGFVLTIEKGDGAIGKFFGKAVDGATELLKLITAGAPELEGSGFSNEELRRIEKAGQIIGQFDASGIRNVNRHILQGDDLKEQERLLKLAADHWDSYYKSVTGGLDEITARQKTYNDNVSEQTAILNKVLNASKEATRLEQERIAKQAIAEEKAKKEKDEFNKEQTRIQKLWIKQDDERNGIKREMIALYDQELGKWVEIERLSLKVTQNIVAAKSAMIGGITRPVSEGGLGTKLELMDEPVGEFKIEQYQDIIDGNEYLANSFLAMSNTIAQSFDQLDGDTNTFVDGMKSATNQIIKMLVAQGTAYLVTNALKTAALGPFGLVIAPALAATAGSIAAGLFGSIIPSFADGGIVSGPTTALVGEYSGAKTNPEVIAPLDKLKDLIGGGVSRVEVTGKLVAEGRDMVIVLDRETTRMDRYGG